MAPEQVLTIPELAERLKVPVSTIRWWRHSGFGPPSWKVGRSVRFDLSAVEAWEAEQRAAGRAAG
jgi:excisionase family DNA binding protein